MNRLERKVLQLVGENPQSPDVFTNDDVGLQPIRDSLNDAIEEISMVTGGNRVKYQIPLVSQNFYRISFLQGHFGWVYSAWLVGEQRKLDQTDLFALGKDNPRWLEVTASPDRYILIGHDIIGVYPRPSTDVLELDVVLIPSGPQNDDDKIYLRSEFEWAAIHYAVSEYWASRGDAREALNHFNKYLDALGLTGIHRLSNNRPYILEK